MLHPRSAGGKFFEKSESLKSSLDTFKNARLALDNGAGSGIIDSALPALDANTQNLRSLANGRYRGYQLRDVWCIE